MHSQGTEGAQSCISVIPTPASVDTARATCASFASTALGSLTDDDSDPMTLPYWHLLTVAR